MVDDEVSRSYVNTEELKSGVMVASDERVSSLMGTALANIRVRRKRGEDKQKEK